MRSLLPTLLLTCLTVVASAAVHAGSTLDLSARDSRPLGRHIEYLQETGHPLDLSEAEQALATGRFQTSRHAILNFGIGAPPVWLALRVDNPTGHYLTRRLLIKNSWVDRIDIYFRQAGAVTSYQRVGDELPFAKRPRVSRYFDLPYSFAPGAGSILMRVQTPDPMALPIQLLTPIQDGTRNTFDNYTFGFVYGALIALLTYNFILFLRLKIWRYAFYSLYLTSFIATNLSYTGHGFWWLWPDSVAWQSWSNPLLMTLYGATGLVFAIFFLETRRHLPRIHRWTVLSVAAFVLAELATVSDGSRVGSLLVAFGFVLFFSVLMVVLGLVSWRAGLSYAKYFLIAALGAVIGAAITALAVWGFIPFNNWTYRAAEIGTLFEAVLLALALADQFRVNVEQKNRAEQLARIDPLTALNNRRGFEELAAPVWSSGLRQKRHMAMILMDLDHFKSFNDTYGHATGDLILKRVGDELKRTARAGDITARWGGEEFILLLPETTLSDAISVAGRLRTGIKAIRLAHRGETLSLTASFGVAGFQGETGDLEALITTTDQQLYRAKQEGRDQVCADQF